MCASAIYIIKEKQETKFQNTKTSPEDLQRTALEPGNTAKNTYTQNSQLQTSCGLRRTSRTLRTMTAETAAGDRLDNVSGLKTVSQDSPERQRRREDRTKKQNLSPEQGGVGWR